MLLDADGVPRIVQRVRVGPARMLHVLLFNGTTQATPIETAAALLRIPDHLLSSTLYSGDPTPLYDDLEGLARCLWPRAFGIVHNANITSTEAWMAAGTLDWIMETYSVDRATAQRVWNSAFPPGHDTRFLTPECIADHVELACLAWLGDRPDGAQTHH